MCDAELFGYLWPTVAAPFTEPDQFGLIRIGNLFGGKRMKWKRRKRGNGARNGLTFRLGEFKWSIVDVAWDFVSSIKKRDSIADVAHGKL